MEETYEDLRNWYLARLRRLFIQQSYGQMLTPAALVEADREIVEKLIAQKSLQSGIKSAVDHQSALAESVAAQHRVSKLILWLVVTQCLSFLLIVGLLWRGDTGLATTLLLVSFILMLLLCFLLFRALRRDIVEPVTNLEKNAGKAFGSDIGNWKTDLAPANQFARLGLLFDRASSALTQSLERERAIADFSQQLVCSVDRAGNVLAISPSVKSMLGYNVRQLVGQPLSRFVDPQDMNSFTAFLAVAGGEQPVAEFDTRAISVEKDMLELHWSVEWSSSKQTLFCTADDVTAERRLERLKQDFVNMITHDLRAPLASMLGRCEVLLSPNNVLDAKVESSVRSMQATGEKILFLVNGLLDVEKFEAGKLQLDLVQADAASIVEAACDTVTPLCDKKQIQLKVDTEHVEFRFDRERIGQVLVNLLSNAWKFSPQGSVIEVKLKKDGAQAVFSVADAGRGIPLEAQTKIFDRFKQLELEDQVTHKGSGLGLAICKALVECHGGTIGVISDVGQGAEFWFKLPIQTDGLEQDP